ncbi:DUF1428 domain-containing protein [Pseudotabrizicola alkalilacus]|uniref:DUF1428 domain-containing protein n=1 Tax=Pseudotabrizicola alkalilacus TaxID=2305252 RepID=A0A411Z7Z1_9RHOB|nr:DUF1428 domain-containing protein [Pseudotabrizicola alkalilacus]MDO9526580.1 DUF1428 domain-containing protein [Gemmobacter sp.]RGP39181.1 DUF1428 domain-containing protein [Pseudotabrizicola alkalilacus]
MNYFDTFVIPVSNDRRDDYIAHEAKWWPEFQKLGALSFVVGWGDDVPPGKHTDFLRSVDLAEGETVVVAWMTWPDKETRNAAYKAMESAMSPDDMAEMPFDGKRMIYGGFVPVLVKGEAA